MSNTQRQPTKTITCVKCGAFEITDGNAGIGRSCECRKSSPMTAQHTKWTVLTQPREVNTFAVQTVVDGQSFPELICEVGNQKHAHLIAAAPDLLEALGFAVLWHRMEVSNGRNGMPKQLLDSVETAITNAIGAK